MAEQKDGFTADPNKKTWWKSWMLWPLLGLIAGLLTIGQVLSSR